MAVNNNLEVVEGAVAEMPPTPIPQVSDKLTLENLEGTLAEYNRRAVEAQSMAAAIQGLIMWAYPPVTVEEAPSRNERRVARKKKEKAALSGKPV